MASNRFGGGIGVQAFDELEQNIEFTERREVLAYAEARLGIELEEFLASPIGRFVAGRAQQEVGEFIDWAMSDEATPEQFMERRAKALAARTLIGWLSEQIVTGLSATQQLTQDPQG